MADSRDDFIIAIRYALLKKGTKQKFSLFFLISLSILTIGLDKLSLPFVLSTRALLNDFVYKVAVITAAPGKFIILLNNKKIEHFNIVAKNKILKKEIKKLEKERYDALYLKAENKSLKQVLELGSARSGYEETTIKARVVLDQKSPYLKSLLINKGTKRNISKGMTVFSQSFLIGTVIETNYLSSRVLLITDLNSKIPVVIQDTSVNAILTGMGKKTQLNLEYLPDDFILEPNKIIYTSGKDGFLAAGLPIAKTYLNKKNKLIIKSLANPQQALVVHVTNGQFNK